MMGRSGKDMRSSPIERKTPLERKTRINRRGRLRVEGHSETAELKREIQSLVRDIVILRDKGCILRDIRRCNGVPGLAVLQADHLITRANSATYADTRHIVCVCRGCHGWKSLGDNQRTAEYDALVKTILPQDRVRLWELAEAERLRAYPMRANDWKLQVVLLKQELRSYGVRNN
jgi:hypothetical protein